MRLPPTEAVEAMCRELGCSDPAEIALLVRASRTHDRWLALDEAGRAPDPPPHVVAEWQAAAALWLALGAATPVMRWPLRKLQDLFGDLFAGDVAVLAARTNDGKSTVAANLIAHLTEPPPQGPGMRGIRVVPIEEGATVYRFKIACIQLGFDMAAARRRQWWKLGPDPRVAEAALRSAIWAQSEPPYRDAVTYADVGDLDCAGLVQQMALARDEGQRLVIVDHLHHMDHGPGPQNDAIRRTMKAVKGAARRYELGVIMLAQIGRPDKRDRRRKFYPPEIEDLQGSSALEQVADVIGLIYRPLLAEIRASDIDDVILHRREWRSVFEPNTIALDCPKHRLDAERVRGQSAKLYIAEGRISDDRPDFRRGDPWRESDGRSRAAEPQETGGYERGDAWLPEEEET